MSFNLAVETQRLKSARVLIKVGGLALQQLLQTVANSQTKAASVTKSLR
ncbi:MAG: hypothetical protein FWD13_07750 [Treponema sp.]|nr:hypothetical protein [Treponema sp.]